MQLDVRTPIRRFKKPLIWSGVIFATFVLLNFVALPPLVKSRLIKKLSVALHREVSIQRVTVNLLTLSLTIRGFLVKDRDVPDTFVSIDELFVNLEGIPALRAALIAKEMRITRPFLRLTRRQDNSYNFSDLFERSETQEAPPGSPFRYSLNNIQVIDGSIDFSDEPKQKSHIVRDVNISVPFISTFPYQIDTFVEPNFSATIDNTRYALVGKAKPFARSRETIFDITIDNFDLAYYFPYVPLETGVRIPSGSMDARVHVSFLQQENGQRALTVKGDLVIKQLLINDTQDSPLLKLPLLSISIVSAEPLARLFHLESVSLQSPEVDLRWNRNGAFNVASLFPRGQQEEGQKGAAGEDTAPPLSLVIDTVRLASGKISFSDLSRSAASEEEDDADDELAVDPGARESREPLTLKAEEIGFNVSGLSTKEGQRADASLSFRFNGKGKVVAKGSLTLQPLAAQVALDVKDIEIRPFQPYFADRVKIIVTNGGGSTSGNLSMTHQEGTGPRITYKGDARLSRFSSIDKAKAEDFLTWESLHLGDFDVGYNPTFVHVKKVALSDFYVRIILHPDGSLNLQQILEAKPAGLIPDAQPHAPATAARTPDKTGMDVQIQRVTLQGGRINFSDYAVKPNFSLNMREMGGRISGLSSEETTLGDVELRGKLGQRAPIEIIGKINPLRKDLYVDLKAKTEDVELSPMTPYSGKYIGYTIQKGKLSFDLSYLIVKKKLDSQHTVFLDQFTLGDTVESPHATKLPVRLAIALLKDRNGEIHLELPVTGSLDDPQFSVWGIIIKILINLLTKAATAPFALLGAAFGGGGEDLGYVEFDYGSVAIADPNLKKLDTLITALDDRPSLKLEIEGHADIEEEKEAIKQYQFSKKLKVQKLNDRVKQGLPAVPVDDLKVEPNEYDKYLTAAYKAEKFPKPRNFLGFAKSLPVPEMEKLMLTNIRVKDDDLRSLASQRAMNVQETILKSGKIEPARVFVVEPKSLSPERREKVRDSRVEFKLR
jgi:hypothetical protein